MSDNVVYAKSAAVTYVDGKRIATKIGEAWAADDPAVKAFPHLFTDDPTARRSIETAAAEPVPEKRGPGRPPKKAAESV